LEEQRAEELQVFQSEIELLRQKLSVEHKLRVEAEKQTLDQMSRYNAVESTLTQRLSNTEMEVVHLRGQLSNAVSLADSLRQELQEVQKRVETKKEIDEKERKQHYSDMIAMSESVKQISAQHKVQMEELGNRFRRDLLEETEKRRNSEEDTKVWKTEAIAAKEAVSVLQCEVGRLKREIAVRRESVSDEQMRSLESMKYPALMVELEPEKSASL
jgi:hypothetical protein